MPRPARAMTWCTVVSLVLVTAYTAALGSNAFLWLSWAVLGLLTAGAALMRR